MNHNNNQSLSKLLELTRGVRMSPEDHRAQRISFAYGTAHIENSNVTRQMVIEAAVRTKQLQE